MRAPYLPDDTALSNLGNAQSIQTSFHALTSMSCPWDGPRRNRKFLAIQRRVDKLEDFFMPRE
ncbi:MAG: hypothetical protein H6922_00280 [Pseudomonadaceae bacterium]|nr:hypothetical protein [Pseudomonadaceae bacterium]